MKDNIRIRSKSTISYFPKLFIIILIILGFASNTSFFSNNRINLSLMAEISESSQEIIFNIPPKCSTVHSPIFINGSNWSTCDAVTGNGTVNDPYIIENLMIDAGKKDGIHIYNSDAYGIIRNCTIWGGTNGIDLVFSSNINITNNTAYNNKYNGFRLFYTFHSTLTRNTAINNLHNGFYIWGMDYYIQDITYIWPSSLSLTENIAINNSLNGFYMRAFASSDFSNNTGDLNLNGISLDLCSNSTFIANNMKNNYYCGIYSTQSNNCTFSENRAINQTSERWGGFCFEIVTNCTISRNLANNNNGKGIFLGQSSNCVIWENNVSTNSGDGIYLYSGSKYFIARNTINDNYGYGILIREYVTNSTITNNWILNNIGGDISENGCINSIYDNIIQTYKKIQGYPINYLLYSGVILILLKKKIEKK